MTHASAASLPVFETGLPALGLALRSVVRAVSGAVQVAGFAAAIWLIVAGPGLLSDHASTVPVEQEAGP